MASQEPTLRHHAMVCAWTIVLAGPFVLFAPYVGFISPPAPAPIPIPAPAPASSPEPWTLESLRGLAPITRHDEYDFMQDASLIIKTSSEALVLTKLIDMYPDGPDALLPFLPASSLAMIAEKTPKPPKWELNVVLNTEHSSTKVPIPSVMSSSILNLTRDWVGDICYSILGSHDFQADRHMTVETELMHGSPDAIQQLDRGCNHAHRELSRAIDLLSVLSAYTDKLMEDLVRDMSELVTGVKWSIIEWDCEKPSSKSLEVDKIVMARKMRETFEHPWPQAPFLRDPESGLLSSPRAHRWPALEHYIANLTRQTIAGGWREAFSIPPCPDRRFRNDDGSWASPACFHNSLMFPHNDMFGNHYTEEWIQVTAWKVKDAIEDAASELDRTLGVLEGWFVRPTERTCQEVCSYAQWRKQWNRTPKGIYELIKRGSTENATLRMWVRQSLEDHGWIKSENPCYCLSHLRTQVSNLRAMFMDHYLRSATHRASEVVRLAMKLDLDRSGMRRTLGDMVKGNMVSGDLKYISESVAIVVNVEHTLPRDLGRLREGLEMLQGMLEANQVSARAMGRTRRPVESS